MLTASYCLSTNPILRCWGRREIWTRRLQKRMQSLFFPPLSSSPLGQFALSSPAELRRDWPKRDCSQSKKYASAVEMSLLHRNKLFPWKWNETPLNETPFRNKHFPLPLPGTYHLFPSLHKKPSWRHIGKREDPGDKPWNQGTPPCTPSFTAISRHNLHGGQCLWHFWLKSWPNLKLWWQYLHLRSLSLFGFVWFKTFCFLFT